MKLSEESELSEFSQLRTQLPDLDNDDCTTSCDELAVNVQPSPEGHQCECHAEKEEKAPEIYTPQIVKVSRAAEDVAHF